MELKIEVEDNICIIDENDEQIISIDMDYDMNEVLGELEELVRYLNKRISKLVEEFPL